MPSTSVAATSSPDLAPRLALRISGPRCPDCTERFPGQGQSRFLARLTQGFRSCPAAWTAADTWASRPSPGWHRSGLTSSPMPATAAFTDHRCGAVVRQELVARQLATHLPDAPQLRVLDVGCGQGTQLLGLARRGHLVTGLDSSTTLLQDLERSLQAEPVAVRQRVCAVHQDANDLTLLFASSS